MRQTQQYTQQDATRETAHAPQRGALDDVEPGEADYWELAPMPPASNSMAGKTLPEAVQHAMAFVRHTVKRSGSLDRTRHAPDALNEGTKVALRMIRNAAGGKPANAYSTVDFHQSTGATILLGAANCMETAFLAGRWLVEQGAVDTAQLVVCLGNDEAGREIDHVLLNLTVRSPNATRSEVFFFDPLMGLLSPHEQKRYLGTVSTPATLGNDPVLFKVPEGARDNLHLYAQDDTGKGHISPYRRARELRNGIVSTVTRGEDGRAILNGDRFMLSDRPRRPYKADTYDGDPYDGDSHGSPVVERSIAASAAPSNTLQEADAPVAAAAPAALVGPTEPRRHAGWHYGAIAAALAVSGAAMAAGYAYT